MATPSIALIPSGYKANKVYSVLPENGDGDFAFTRASEATRINSSGLIETMLTGVPRLDYEGGGCPSLLLEPQSTNLVLRSEDFSSSSWGAGNVTVSLSTVVSPNGVDFAYKVTNTGSGFLIQGYNSTNRLTDSRSIWARTVSGTGQLNLLSNNTNSNNLFTVTEQWQRFEATGYNSTGASNFYAIDFRGSSTLTEVLIWGGQAEDFSYPTSYIKTEGSTVTRVSETATGSGTVSDFNSEEGVLYAEIKALDDSGNRRISISNGNSDNQNELILGYHPNSNTVQYFLRVGNSMIINQIQSVSSTTEFLKIAVKWKLNDFALWINGIEVYSLGTGIIYAAGVLNTLSFSEANSGNPFYGKTKDLRVYKTALSDIELRDLTNFADSSFIALANRLNYNII